MKRRIKATPHPALSPVEAERVVASQENAPMGAIIFFVHGVACYAIVAVLQTSCGGPAVGRGAGRPHPQPLSQSDGRGWRRAGGGDEGRVN